MNFAKKGYLWSLVCYNVHNVKVKCDLLHQTNTCKHDLLRQRNIIIFLMQEVMLHFH